MALSDRTFMSLEVESANTRQHCLFARKHGSIIFILAKKLIVLVRELHRPKLNFKSVAEIEKFEEVRSQLSSTLRWGGWIIDKKSGEQQISLVFYLVFTVIDLLDLTMPR